MFIWNKDQSRQDILIQLNEAIFSNEPIIRIFVNELPSSVDNRVLLTVFKKQLENYPKKIEFIGKNLDCLELLDQAGFVVIIPEASKKEDQKNLNTTLRQEKKILPSVIELLKSEKEEQKQAKKKEQAGVTLFPIELVIQKPETKKNIIETKEEIKEEKSKALVKVNDLALRIERRVEEKTIIKKIDFDKYKNEKNRVSFESKVTKNTFSQLTSALEMNLEDDFDEMLNNVDKIKLNISSQRYSLFASNVRVFASIFIPLLIIVIFVAYINYIPAYAYKINLKNNSQSKQEMLAITPNLFKEKVLNLSIYSEQQVPKQKKEFFEKAKGTVVLFSTGSNSCTLSNGGFLASFNNKYYKVLPNYSYANQVTIEKSSQNNPTLTFDIEAVEKSSDYNVPKDTIFSLSNNYKEILSKSCYAKATSPVNDYILKDNNTVTEDIVKSLETFSSKAINEKVKEEIETMAKNNNFSQDSWIESDNIKNIFNSEVGEVKDLVTLNRLETKRVKYLPIDSLQKKIQENEPVNKNVKNIKINNTEVQDNQTVFNVTYDLVDKSNIDSEKIKEIINKSNKNEDINSLVKKEFPNIENIQKVNDGLDLPIFKRINLEIVD